MLNSGSYLLRHTLNNVPSDSHFSYVKPYDGPDEKSDLPQLLDVKISKYLFADKKKKTVYIDNPILTDVTQAVHTDIKKILAQNPDVNGLSLILEDSVAEHNASAVQFEDFMLPSQYRDIFDIQEFVERSKRSFNLLPASLRKQYNNNPAELCSALDKKDPRAVSAINDFLGLSQTNSVSQASGQKTDVDVQNSMAQDAPVSDGKQSSKDTK